MAYASVAQADHDAFDRDSPLNSPPLPEISSPPLLPPYDAFSGDGDHFTESQTESQTGPPSTGVSSLLKSISSTPSYQMVEDEDYEEPMPTPRGVKMKREDESSSQKDDTITFQSEEPPMRTASISRHLPLNHPTPDLHALQGALVKNVERLEESAERLSMTSSLEDELNKMRLDQKRSDRQSSAPASLDPSLQRQISAGSWTNSIIGVNQAARSGGYSPAGYITSPTGSVRSGLWSHLPQLERHSSKGSQREAALPEPPLEGRPLDLTVEAYVPVATIPEQASAIPLRESSNGSISDERPNTSASNDTYRQAQSAFRDFDGVHYSTGMPRDPMGSVARQISLRHPPRARDSRAYKEAQPGEQMIYYPAPVPAMLNLPQRLSKMNFSEREKRRLQGLSGIPDAMRNSAAWLAESSGSATQRPAAPLNVPAQLRASAFFEYPSVTQDLQLKNGSAVQTLDSILDAAAYAPVSAFTDHPIAGHLGKEVYGLNDTSRKSVQLPDGKATKRRSSLGTMLKTRPSSAGVSDQKSSDSKIRTSKALGDDDDYATGDELDQAAADSIAPDADELGQNEGKEENEGSVVSPGFSTAPTTLLAELQMRKEQQRRRNRTAADAFPSGMRSTLLEMDAVTQLQQKARKTKHVTLAWEDHDEADKQNFDDEDVPLGLLFPEKDRARSLNVHRPVGLLERRELEDNEPLSHRRARLRGEPLQSLKSDTRSEAEETGRAPFIKNLPGLSEETLPEKDGETLAARAARLKLEKEKGAGGQFVEEVSSQLGLSVEPNAPRSSKTPDGEETLAQRRKRLKEEALRGGAPTDTRPHPKSMLSLADVLQAHPVGPRSREVSGESKAPKGMASYAGGPFLQFEKDSPYPAAYPNHTYHLPQQANWGYAQQNRTPADGVYGNGNGYMNGAYGGTQLPIYGASIPLHMQQPMAFYPYGYGNQPYLQDPMMGPPLDPKQRAQIDRWRQSIGQ